jgi:hypothetical protein
MADATVPPDPAVWTPEFQAPITSVPDALVHSTALGPLKLITFPGSDLLADPRDTGVSERDGAVADPARVKDRGLGAGHSLDGSGPPVLMSIRST